MTSVIFGSFFVNLRPLFLCKILGKGCLQRSAISVFSLRTETRQCLGLSQITGLEWTIFETLRQLRSVSWSLTQGATCNLVQSVILGQIEYCNLALAGLPQRNIFWLQVVINAAADLVLQFYESNPISTRIQDELQWLRKGKRIQHLCILVHKCLNNCITPLWQAASGCYQMTR